MKMHVKMPSAKKVAILAGGDELIAEIDAYISDWRCVQLKTDKAWKINMMIVDTTLNTS